MKTKPLIYRVLARLRSRARYWRRMQREITNDPPEQARCAANAWGVEEAIGIVERMIEQDATRPKVRGR